MQYKIKAIVYDFDGTLVKSEEYLQRKFTELYKSVGKKEVKLESDVLEVSDWVNKLKKLRIPIRRAKKIYLSEIYSIEFYQHAKEMLEYVHSLGHPQGIATNSPRSVVETVLEQYKLADCIDKMITFDEILKLRLKPKPEPDSLVWLADQLDVKPENCLYVGDTQDDIKAGKKAGMITVGAAYQKKKIKKLVKACPDLGIMTSSKQMYNLVRLLFV